MRHHDLLLHPVRMRIVQALLGDRELTTAQLREELPDVPAATLYRQVANLLEGGAIEVADERKVRGTFERTYRASGEHLHVDAEDAAGMSEEQHLQAFTSFMASRLADFERYLDAGDPDLGRDRVGYRTAALHLTDRETDQMLRDLRRALEPYLAKKPRRTTKRRMFSTILMPR